MEPTRWQRIETIFHDLTDLPPGHARDQALAARCGDDTGLAEEVRALLDEDAGLAAAVEAADPHLGLRLGHFEVTALIARGGMAAVYEARRADEQFQQRVAIKIMDLRLSDPALVAQFRSERQILAALEHPSLTRLLDGGVTAFGEPYLVMEYIEGQPIDRYCDEQRLDVRERLRLFAEVCGGVAFAHRNLVLHRDLKPSNILVTTEGRAKVVDFGTATLLQPDRLATTSRPPFTPAYASPEQLVGHAVGTASDQFSLGLVLFELLTGAPAFGDRTSLMAGVERALAGTTTAAPQAVVTEAAARSRGRRRWPRCGARSPATWRRSSARRWRTSPSSATPASGNWPTTWSCGPTASRSWPGPTAPAIACGSWSAAASSRPRPSPSPWSRSSAGCWPRSSRRAGPMPRAGGPPR